MCISTNLTEIIQTKGLSVDRQWYLHDTIRQFCSDDCKDSKPSNPSLTVPPPSTSVMDSDTVSEDEL